MDHFGCIVYLLMVMCLRMSLGQSDKETEITDSVGFTPTVLKSRLDSITMDSTPGPAILNRCKTPKERTGSCKTCQRGYYGEDTCNMTCNPNCNMNICNISTGACTYGCNETKRSSSTSQWYGQDCSEKCNDKCRIGYCFRNGTCYLGCKDGSYGEKCHKTCPSNCNGSCNVRSGRCEGYCKPGFYGDYCDTSCSQNCNDGDCFMNGTCYNCTNGYRGPMCESHCAKYCRTCNQFGHNCTLCETGRFGHQCNNRCDHCQGSCEFEDGQCTNGCKQGYYGTYCGSNCSSNCQKSGTVAVCGQVTGHCKDGCINGWYGNHCNRSCSSGCLSQKCNISTGQCSEGCLPTLYGDFCNNTCSSNCLDSHCTDDAHYPQCSIGCKTGFWGSYCKYPCPPNCVHCNKTNGTCFVCSNNTYGTLCEHVCHENCHHRNCNINGVCALGCIPGYHDNVCDVRCPIHCNTCDRYNGTCLTCMPGWTGLQCKDSTKVVLFYALVIIFLLTAAGTLASLVYIYLKRYCKKRASYSCDQWLRWPARQHPTDSYHCYHNQWQPSSQTLAYRHSKRLTLRDEGNKPLPRLSRQDMADLLLSNNRKSVLVKTDRYSVNSIICNNRDERHYSRNSRRTVSQCRKLEDQMRVKESIAASSGTARYDGKASRMFAASRVIRDPDKDNKISHSRNYTDGDLPASPGGSLEGFGQSLPPCPGHIAMETSVRPASVNCQDFNDYVQRIKRHSGFQRQFKDLPEGELAVCDEAKRPENLALNRFVNIHPYDHSRVILHNDLGNGASDYINANYVNGYGKPKYFIAAQGPFSDNIGKFLKMVCQTKATTIVMLTKLFENDRMKCGKYWDESRQYGDVHVQTLQEEAKGDYCVRCLSLQQERREQHTVLQYHYTAWPDHGQPRDPRSLLDFYTHVKTSVFGGGPVIVHCSAGVGRTGTFIALDYLLDQAAAEGKVDVHECVKRLRYQRMNMVQNEAQYIFLHDIVAVALAETRHNISDRFIQYGRHY